MSATPDNRLADPEQRIADLEHQLAEAREQQTATAEVLKVISRSAFDLDTVLDTLTRSAATLCGAATGVIHFREGEQFRVGASFGHSPDYWRWRQSNPLRPGRDSTAARVLLSHVVEQVNDIQTDPEIHPNGKAFSSNRTALGVPLLREGQMEGVFLLGRTRVEPFSPRQIELVQTFADQALIAIENARLFNEVQTRTRDLKEALEQQTATAEVLQVINSSPGNLAPVFEAMLERAMRLCGASHGTLTAYDGDQFRCVAAYGLPDRLFEMLRQARGAVPGSPQERLLRGEAIVHIVDFEAMHASLESDEWAAMVARTAAEIGGVRTILFVPLRKDDRLLGYITANRREVRRPFSDKQIALLQNFAAQAVIAMENARLLTETREGLEQQTATAEVLKVISRSAFDLQPVLDTLIESAVRLCNATRGHLRLREGDLFPLHAFAGNYSAESLDFLRQNPIKAGRGTITGRAVLTGLPQNVADVTTDPEYDHPELLKHGGLRSFLGVPLLRDGQVEGVLSLGRQEVQPFTPRQVELVTTFADQAVIAIKNARLFNEVQTRTRDLAEALEQQTATAEILAVINSSPGELATVFDAILEKALRLCGAEFGSMLTYNGESFQHVADHGVPAAYASHRRSGGPIVFGRGTTPARLVAGEDVVHTADLKSTEPYERGDPNRRALVDLGGARSVLSVALRKDDALLGMISVYRQEVRPFSDKQIALLQSFAAQAVIAMENARLLDELRQRTGDLEEALEQQTATAEVLQVINSSPGDLTPVFEAMLEKALRLCEAAFGIINTYDGELFHPVAMRSPPALADTFRSAPNLPRASRHSGLRRIVLGEDVVQIEDLAADPVYQEGEARRAIEAAGAHSYLGVALRLEGKLLGTIGAYRQEVRPFSDKEVALLQSFAAQAVIAMENARLLDELRQRTDQVAELNRGLEARVAEQVEELGRVGRLKRFLAPQLAQLIVSQGDEKILESHRREIVVVFCDLRGYTAFTETAEPEEVLDFLRDYHGALGPLVAQFEGTLDQFSGDGIMVFFNDPVPIPDPAERAIRMAVAMRGAAEALIAKWRRRGRELGFGAGIAQSYATLGQIGFAERSGYTAIGTVCNLAARLCAEAKDGQILLAQRLAVAVEEVAVLEEIGPLSLKGLTQPVVAYNVPRAAIQPALRVIEGGPQSV